MEKQVVYFCCRHQDCRQQWMITNPDDKHDYYCPHCGARQSFRNAVVAEPADALVSEASSHSESGGSNPLDRTKDDLEVSLVPIQGTGDILISVKLNNVGCFQHRLVTAKAENGEIMKGVEMALAALGWKPDFESMWLDDAMILSFHKEADKTYEARFALMEWINKQGHERCWYYPEIFRKLCGVLGVTITKPMNLPPRPEFGKGCDRYEREVYEQGDLLPPVPHGEEA